MEQRQIEERYQEIRSLASNFVTIERAILYLMDFINDICQDENKDELIDKCIVFKMRYSKGFDDVEQLCVLCNGVLSFTRNLINQYKGSDES